MKLIRVSASLIILIAAFILSCSKSAGITGSIGGKWNLVIDSSYSQVGSSARKYQIHVGQPGDYWDFRSDSFVYVKEGSVLDTLAYSISSPDTITINTFGATFNGITSASSIVSLSRFSVTIQSANLLSPGGVYSRILYLSR